MTAPICFLASASLAPTGVMSLFQLAAILRPSHPIMAVGAASGWTITRSVNLNRSIKPTVPDGMFFWGFASVISTPMVDVCRGQTASASNSGS